MDIKMELYCFTILALFGANWVQVKGQMTQQCEKCNVKKCTQLQFCPGEVVKDHCNCCFVCSSDPFQPNPRPVRKKGNACEEVKCPRMKVCMENMQGLPLCMCPSIYICRRMEKELCGIDNKTYQSRCHMRIAACHVGKRVKVQHKGKCKPVIRSITPDESYGDYDHTRKIDPFIKWKKRRNKNKGYGQKRRHRNKRYGYLRTKKYL